METFLKYWLRPIPQSGPVPRECVMFDVKSGRVSKTLDERMAIARGHPQGFDYVRINLAIAVLVAHTLVICYGEDAAFAVEQTMPLL
jgi:hypothetical protein